MSIYIQVEGFKEFKKAVQDMKGNIDVEANHLLGNISAHARRETSSYPGLKMGQHYTQKWSMKKGWIRNPQGTRWSTSTGVWIASRSNSPKPMRMINFKFNNRKGTSPSVSIASSLANLWEHNAHYSKHSGPLWSINGITGGWGKGTRQARPWFFSQLGANVEMAIPGQIIKTEKKLAESFGKN